MLGCQNGADRSTSGPDRDPLGQGPEGVAKASSAIVPDTVSTCEYLPGNVTPEVPAPLPLEQILSVFPAMETTSNPACTACASEEAKVELNFPRFSRAKLVGISSSD